MRASPQPAPLHSIRVTRGGRSKYAVKECHCGRDEQGAHAAATPRLHAHACTLTPRSHAPLVAPQSASARCRASAGPPCESCCSGWSASTSTLPSASFSSSRARCGLQPHASSLQTHASALQPMPPARGHARTLHLALILHPALCTSPSLLASPSGARGREDAAAAAPLPRAHGRHRAAARRRRGGAQGQG